jgi:tRNA sulfurtransferase ThiI
MSEYGRLNPSAHHYLDNAATTRVHPQVAEQMARALTEVYGNPAALHQAGTDAEHWVEQARRSVAGVMGVRPERLIFTSGGTESNNLAIRGVVRAAGRRPCHVITTAIEHSSVLATVQHLARDGVRITVLPVDASGTVDVEALGAAIDRDTVLVSVGYVNNELGTVQPVRDVAQVVRERRDVFGRPLWFHVDAVQALGKVPDRLGEIGADLITVSGHKIHGPKGIGALYVGEGVRLEPLQTGGDQEGALRPGTPNVPGIVGFGAAARILEEAGDGPRRAMAALKERLLAALAERLPWIVVNGPDPTRAAPHIVNLGVPGARGEFLVHALSARGVYVATGSACTARRATPSHVLTAIGLSPELLQASLRISLSAETTPDDIDALVEALEASTAELAGIVRGPSLSAHRARPAAPAPAPDAPPPPAPATTGRVLLVRYGEIGLKGANRSYFERLLATRLSEHLQGAGALVRRSGGRIWVEVEGAWEPVVRRLQQVFGVVAVTAAQRVPLSWEALRDAVVGVVRARQPFPSTFKIDAHRANKRFFLTSVELNRRLGRAVQEAWPSLAVDLHHPELTVRVEIRDDAAYVWERDYPGPGGLPVGASGRAVALLSGGFDSPVATWLALKRGMRCTLVYFHSPPFTSEQALDKVVRIAEVLAGWGGVLRLYVVYFGGLQAAIQRDVPERLRITVMRRMMFRLAERIAAKEHAVGLVTGESLGQVASQTPESLQVIGAVTRLPVLRPVIGLDKTEILERAHAIGTYEWSALPYEDCCTVFQPVHPATKPTLAATEAAEAVRDWEPLLKEALDRTERRLITRAAD